MAAQFCGLPKIAVGPAPFWADLTVPGLLQQPQRSVCRAQARRRVQQLSVGRQRPSPSKSCGLTARVIQSLALVYRVGHRLSRRRERVAIASSSTSDQPRPAVPRWRQGSHAWHREVHAQHSCAHRMRTLRPTTTDSITLQLLHGVDDLGLVDGLQDCI